MAHTKELPEFNCNDERVNYTEHHIKKIFDENNNEFFDIFNFFLYDSQEYINLKKKTKEFMDNKYDELIKELNIIHHFEYGRNAKSKYKDLGLDEDNICFVCQRLCISIETNEDKLSAIIRHIRNSIAHVQIYKNEDNFLFQDIGERKYVSARIVINKQNLFKLYNFVKKIIDMD